MRGGSFGQKSMNKCINCNVVPQAVPAAQVPDQARRAGRHKPAKGSQATGNVEPKGKMGRPAKLRVAAACSVLPSLLTLELCFTGTVSTVYAVTHIAVAGGSLCCACVLLWPDRLTVEAALHNRAGAPWLALNTRTLGFVTNLNTCCLCCGSTTRQAC